LKISSEVKSQRDYVLCAIGVYKKKLQESQILAILA